MEKTKLQIIYNDLASTYGYSSKSLHWGSKKRQEIPFKAIINEVDLNKQTVLDVGCGFGDFYYYLKRKKIKLKNYLGVDVAENIIKIGRKKHLEIADKLKAVNFLKNNFNRKFDYVIISGLFNLKLKNNKQFLTNSIRKSFALCNKGILFNLISTEVDFKEKHLYYVDPGWIFKFCKTLTKWVNIKYDYNPWEFLIACYKNKK